MNCADVTNNSPFALNNVSVAGLKTSTSPAKTTDTLSTNSSKFPDILEDTHTLTTCAIQVECEETDAYNALFQIADELRLCAPSCLSECKSHTRALCSNCSVRCAAELDAVAPPVVDLRKRNSCDAILEHVDTLPSALTKHALAQKSTSLPPIVANEPLTSHEMDAVDSGVTCDLEASHSRSVPNLVESVEQGGQKRHSKVGVLKVLSKRMSESDLRLKSSGDRKRLLKCAGFHLEESPFCKI